ncbi:Cell wall hydrolase CwlJ, involved in spore germination [Nitrosomonas marina]|uniref:Cell wall hydrolase CwlJ, involved in spore germination n=1 Tax=Nitrosomonas marina TaxID=917 RepID=A0A1I0DRF9_9PROT|nr:cell wall hydrolase [Nitrosomonas marina]SET35160.1 Cell wall hydrolase CwlJ, involved in spore germination [Nitrosomonas marina]
MQHESLGVLVAVFFWFSPALAAGDRPDTMETSENAERAENKAIILEQKAVTDDQASSSATLRTIAKHEAQAVDPDGEEPLDDAITCLSRTIYWEARGQQTTEMEAIASVVMNRLNQGDFPNTICNVVKQGNEQGSCQFSWWCDGRPDEADEETYTIAKEIARRALNQQLTDRTQGATFFHHRDTRPDWSMEFIRTSEIGEHVFYKTDSAK